MAWPPVIHGDARTEIDKKVDGTTVARSTIVTTENSTSTTFTDLATVGPSVTVTVTAHGKVLALFSFVAFASSVPVNSYAALDISGATTVAAAFPNQAEKVWTTVNESGTVINALIIDGLNAGSTTFKMKYAIGSAGPTVSFLRRTLSVIPL